MPSIELYDPSAHADGWHDVRSPGGYEWWYFDAEDAATDTQVVAIFMQGFIFHPGYLRAHARFIKRPTRTPPPTAADYPCVYLCVYRGGRIWKQFFTQYAPAAFRAARDRCDVTIGEGSVVRVADGAFVLRAAGTPWELTARGPVRLASETLSAQLDFLPRRDRISDPVASRRFLSHERTGADHFWSIVAPRCDVEGRIDCGGEVIAFRGRGYHDHNYGTAPIGAGLSRWTWGRAMFADDRVVTFHYPEYKETGRPPYQETARPRPECATGRTEDGPSLSATLDGAHLVVVDADGTREVSIDRVTGDWSPRSKPAMMLRYPRTLDFGPALRLSEPRVVDPSPFYLRLMMKAESFGETSTAFCEVAYPHRLRWPLLGRMIEMSFDKRAMRPVPSPHLVPSRYAGRGLG